MKLLILAAARPCLLYTSEAGCALAVVELPDAGLAEALPKMPVCAVTSIGPDGISASLELSLIHISHPDQPQQDEPHQQAGHHTGKIDPDIGDLAARCV